MTISPVLTTRIDHFTIVCSVTWPLDGSEAEGDLVLIQTSLLLLFKTNCSDANYVHHDLHDKNSEGQLQPRCHPKARSLSTQQ